MIKDILMKKEIKSVFKIEVIVEELTILEME